jgi:hypothetical protein
MVGILACTPASSGADSEATTLVPPSFGHTMGYYRASSYLLKLLLRGRVEIDDPQGIACVKLRCLDDPSSTDDDDELTVLAVNSGDHQIVYNVGLQQLEVFGAYGRGPGQFWWPRGICAGTDGTVYVADTGNNRIVRLHMDGEKLSYVTNIGSFGADAGEFDDPHQVALDSRGHLYVTDTSNDRVQIFDSEGQFLLQFGGPDTKRGRLRAPQGIAVIDRHARWSYYHKPFIVVSDSGNHRIQKFSLDGELIQSVTAADIGSPNSRFAYLAIDYYSNVYATDPVRDCIHKFDRNLTFIVSFGSRGTGTGEFISPRGICIWRRFGQVFIAEEGGGQYYWIGVDGKVRGCFPPEFSNDSPGTVISFYLTEPAYVRMKVFGPEKTLIRDLLPKLYRNPLWNEIIWDGLDDRNQAVRPGQYTIEITLEPTYASKGYFKKILETDVQCLLTDTTEKRPEPLFPLLRQILSPESGTFSITP